MLRILQCVNNMHRAGLETMLMNYYRHINREKIQFDFLMHREEKSDYDDEIESLGGRIYRASRLYPQNYPAYFRFMKTFFSEHPEYRVVHSHIDAMSYLPLRAAKMAGVPVRIAHSHNTGIDLDFKYPLKQLFRFSLPSVVTHRFSCGEEAGKFLFRGKSFDVIPNAVDAKYFSFDPVARMAKRQELGLGDRFVVGHVGRMSYQKNHFYLLRIFSELLKLDPKAMLMLVGTGEREAELKQRVADLGISGSVMFLGSRSDVRDLYQAMDVFVLPSLFEGIPVVGVEAQFAGLPCLFSKAVPEEVAFSSNCHFLDLKTSAKEWAEKIIAIKDVERQKCEYLDSDYRIENAAQLLECCYFSFM